MPKLSTYKQTLGHYGKSSGEAKKIQSDMIMEQTWDRDLQSCKAYIYDFYHDDESTLNTKMEPFRSTLKVPIDIKFIINSYNSDGKDQVSYHLQFRPSQECPLDYFRENYELKYGVEFPIGLYIDIPDAKNIYRRWLIVDKANSYNQQFATWSILPCDYRFCWIYKNKRYKMWGVSRSQSSYNSGVWTDYKVETVENQRKFWLPFNEHSSTLFYNQRMIVSAPTAEPITWRITKVENAAPLGVNKLTLAQDKFDQHKDYIEKDEFGNVVAMWADYFSSEMEPEVPEKKIESTTHGVISYSGIRPQIKIGGNARIYTINYYDIYDTPIEHETGQWSFAIEGAESIDSLLSITYPTIDSSLNSNQIKLQFLGSDDYIGSILTIKNVTFDNIETELDIEIVGL